jgi:uncharacterized heparinase superfamily protein
MTGPARFRFLSMEREVDLPGDWNRPDVPKLWLYHLHYFDDLNATDAAERASWHREFLARWVSENPPAEGNGWEPYPIARRVVNWIKWAWSGSQLEPAWVASLAVQVRWLRSHLEWHLLGNHLLADAKALVFAGCFFTGPEADEWLKRGLAIWSQQLTEQVLSDGGHFELSPMYHAATTADVLDVLQLMRKVPARFPDGAAGGLASVASSMLGWLVVMTHPDGDIVQFNDAAFDGAPATTSLCAYATQLGVTWTTPRGRVLQLSASGYVRVDCEAASAFLDVAPIGPDYLPGHAHADTLTFELSLFGERWIVDGGCSTYDASEQRLRERGTAAHNTVIIDDLDSSEVWSSFRVARRARVHGTVVREGAAGIEIRAEHHGYRRLGTGVVHYRQWTFNANQMCVRDVVSGAWKTAVAHVLVHPEVTTTRVADAAVSLRRGERQTTLAVRGGTMELVPATWHPRFGESVRTTRLRIRLAGREVATTLTWS